MKRPHVFSEPHSNARTMCTLQSIQLCRIGVRFFGGQTILIAECLTTDIYISLFQYITIFALAIHTNSPIYETQIPFTEWTIRFLCPSTVFNKRSHCPWVVGCPITTGPTVEVDVVEYCSSMLLAICWLPKAKTMNMVAHKILRKPHHGNYQKSWPSLCHLQKLLCGGSGSLYAVPFMMQILCSPDGTAALL